jgi:NAD(P)-dependent dehydrogenase (short-subunit alcohol dehydrogenase family)
MVDSDDGDGPATDDTDDGEIADDYEHTPVSVEGERAVVIGGTSGIGGAIARGFAAEGADVIATSRTASKVESTAADLRARGARTATPTCDVTDPEDVAALVATAVDEFGGVDVVVHSQGAIARERVDEASEAEWRRVLDVALDGVYRSTKAFAREMDAGAIVNVSSLTARIGFPETAAYTAAKGGVDALTRAAAAELGPAIRVNAVAPGFVLTPQNREVYAEGTDKRETIDARAAMGRVATREEMVGAVVYLASDAASYTTGEVLTVDGGFTTGTF